MPAAIEQIQIGQRCGRGSHGRSMPSTLHAAQNSASAQKSVQIDSGVLRSPTAAPPCAPDAANRCLPAASITALASAQPCHSSACGHTKRPRSSRLANRQSPSPSHHSTLIRSPRRPRKTNTWPENGSAPASSAPARSARRSRAACRSLQPRSRCAFSPAARSSLAATPAPRAAARHRRRFQCGDGSWETRCRCCRRWGISAAGEASLVTGSTPRLRRLAHAHRQQTDAVRLLLAQPALAIEVAPVMHHVGVDPMLPRHPRHRCPGCIACSTIRRFSAMLRRCRLGCSIFTTVNCPSPPPARLSSGDDLADLAGVQAVETGRLPMICCSVCPFFGIPTSSSQCPKTMPPSLPLLSPGTAFGFWVTPVKAGTWGTETAGLRQRQRVYQPGDGSVGLSEWGEDRLLAPRQAHRQCLCGVVQWNLASGVSECPLVRNSGRSAAINRGLAERAECYEFKTAMQQP